VARQPKEVAVAAEIRGEARPGLSAGAALPLPDLEKLLAPISGAQPAGEWLRYDPLFDQIREARREEDPDLPQGVWKTEVKKANWPEVARLASEALEGRSKDLQLAGWLTEAWTRLHGFAGAQLGVRLLSGLCEGFWDEVHPRPQNGDLEVRLSPLVWLDSYLAQALRQVPVTRPETEDGELLCWLDWETLLHRSKVARRDTPGGRRPEEGPTSDPSRFTVSVSLTGSVFYLELEHQLEGLRQSTADLGNLLQQRAGDEAPSLAQSRELQDRLRRFVLGVLRQRREEETTMAEPAANPRPLEPSRLESAEDGIFTSAGPIKSRAEAYRRLAEAADYLSRTEPHSPTPYLVRRAVAWGGMTVTELLQELLADNADLKTVFKLLGLAKQT
jgi:type VI secretion system ImpA family protein